MLVLSDVLTALGVVLLVCAIWARRRYILTTALLALMFWAWAVALALLGFPGWQPLVLWVCGAVHYAGLILELTRRRRAQEAAWCEICSCCEHPDDATAPDTTGGV